MTEIVDITNAGELDAALKQFCGTGEGKAPLLLEVFTDIEKDASATRALTAAGAGTSDR